MDDYLVMDSDAVTKLRSISAQLNDHYSLSWDQRRDLANLLDLVLMTAVRIKDSDLN